MQRHDSQESMGEGSTLPALHPAPLASSPSGYTLRPTKRRRHTRSVLLNGVVTLHVINKINTTPRIQWHDIQESMGEGSPLPDPSHPPLVSSP